MMGGWKKLGLIYSAENKKRHEKLLTHTANPIAVELRDNVYRIFYSGRDALSKSSVGAFDFNMESMSIVEDYYDPFLTNGNDGSYYGNGISIGDCYIHNGKRYMLFMGWSDSNKGHWQGKIGRITLDLELNLKIESKKPLLDFDMVDQISYSYPCIWQENNILNMIYGTTKSWESKNGEMLHILKHAYSIDGNHWIKTENHIPYEIDVAQAFSRPTAIYDEMAKKCELWFSYRGGLDTTYRIGQATKSNGNDWILKIDNPCIDVSPKGWDSQMTEYPFIFKYRKKKYMLYNGNGYGYSGIGIAEYIITKEKKI